MNAIPTREQNPEGLHQRYIVTKADGTPADGTYIVLRIDNAGNDKVWLRACRYAIYCLATYILDKPDEAAHLQQLAKDLSTSVAEFNGYTMRYVYIGADEKLQGLTALGRYRRWVGFVVQVDNPSHEWSRGWHLTNRNDWRLN